MAKNQRHKPTCNRAASSSLDRSSAHLFARNVGQWYNVHDRYTNPELEAAVYQPPASEPVAIRNGGVAYRVGGGMRRDDEIEAVGMREAMRHEREHDWHPEDVSAENLGFDIRSTRYNDDGSYTDTRYIEVKARAQSGAIRLSANEWKQARKFGAKYWLYIVTQAATDDPHVVPIQDPAARFQVGEDIFATGFIIPEDRWRERTEQ